MESSEKRKVIKVMILGGSGVGKSSILDKYVNKTFSGSYKVTLGSDFLTLDTEVAGHKVRLQLWDTAGQEKYRSLSVSYYRGSDACVFVFDVTDKDSFEDLDSWVQLFFDQLAEGKRDGFPVILIGNKADKGREAVSKDTIKQWCDRNNHMKYFETSAKTGQGLDEAFSHISILATRKAIEDEY